MLGQRLEVRQGQGLVITPQLQQAIKLLQLSNLELDAFVEAELERNPLLSRDEPDGDGAEAPERVETASESELSFNEDRPGEAAQAMDARDDDLYGDAAPGERSGDRAPDTAHDAATDQPGLSDWSRANRGGIAPEGEGERNERREANLWEHLQAQASSAGGVPISSGK